MISLDGLELNPSMNWVERFESAGVAQSARVTLGGRPVISSAQLQGGRHITLVATHDSGWLTKAVIDQLVEMAKVPGRMLQLTYHDSLTSVLVVFRHHEAPALVFTPLAQKSYYEATDYFSGTIKLLEV